MEDWNGFMTSKSKGFGVMTSSSSSRRRVHNNNKNEEFEEEDMLWKETEYPHYDYEDHSCHVINKLTISSDSSSSTPRKIPKGAHNNNNNNMITTQENLAKKVVQVQRQQSSAPMKIPDWSKIYGSWGKNNNSNKYDDLDHDHDHDHDYDHDHDDDDDGMVPPHEWVARNQISSFSVCEGIGRTLKGRDLSEVRNAILTKTGFLE